MMGALLVRTIVAQSETELRAKVAAAQREGWVPVGNPSRLYVGGQPVGGRASWMWAMERRSD